MHWILLNYKLYRKWSIKTNRSSQANLSVNLQYRSPLKKRESLEWLIRRPIGLNFTFKGNKRSNTLIRVMYNVGLKYYQFYSLMGMYTLSIWIWETFARDSLTDMFCGLHDFRLKFQLSNFDFKINDISCQYSMEIVMWLVSFPALKTKNTSPYLFVSPDNIYPSMFLQDRHKLLKNWKI